MMINYWRKYALLFCVIPMVQVSALFEISNGMQFEDSNFPDAEDDCTNCDKLPVDDEIAKELIYKYLQESKRKQENKEPNVFDLLKLLPKVFLNKKYTTDTETSLILKETQTNLENQNVLPVEKMFQSRKAKREVASDEQEPTMAGPIITPTDLNEKTANEQTFQIILRPNVRPNSENAVDVNQATQTDKKYTRSSEVDNFQDSDVVDSNDLTTNDSTATPIELTKSLENDEYLNSHIQFILNKRDSDSDSEDVKVQILENSSYTTNNIKAETTMTDVTDDHKTTNYEFSTSSETITESIHDVDTTTLHITDNGVNTNENITNILVESKPKYKDQSKTSNIKYSTEGFTLQSDYSSTVVEEESTSVTLTKPETLYHESSSQNIQTEVKLPLSSNQLSNLQNVLQTNFSVNNKHSQPVANFQLNKTRSDENPVVVIVYNCSCANNNHKETENEKRFDKIDTNADVRLAPSVKQSELKSEYKISVASPNTRRRMQDIPIVRQVSTNSNLNEIKVKGLNTVEKKIKNTLQLFNHEQTTIANNKPSNAMLENELLAKCASLLGLQNYASINKPKLDDSKSSSVQSIKEDSLQKYVQDTKENLDLLPDNVNALPNTNDIVLNNSHLVKNNKLNVINSETHRTESESNLTKASDVISPIDVLSTEVQRKKRNTNDNLDTHNITFTAREKRDFTESINDFLQYILRIPATGMNIVTNSFTNDETDFNNRRKREIIMKDNYDYPEEDMLLGSENGTYKSNETRLVTGRDLERTEYTSVIEGGNRSADYQIQIGADIPRTDESNNETSSLTLGDLESDKRLTEVLNLIRPIQVNVYLDLLLKKFPKTKEKHAKH